MDLFSPEFSKILEEQRKRFESMAKEDAELVSKQMMGLNRYEKKQLLKSMAAQLGGHPLIGFIFKLLMERATAQEDYEVCAAIQETANEMKVEMADIGKIMKKVIAENPDKNLFLDVP